jgi:hypothetical protein
MRHHWSTRQTPGRAGQQARGCARHSEIDARTTRHPGYAISQNIHKRIEEVFGWTKSAAGMRLNGHAAEAFIWAPTSSAGR